VTVSSSIGGPILSGIESMALYYDNDGDVNVPTDPNLGYSAPNFSEIEANTTGPNSLNVGENWAAEGVQALALLYQGHSIADGSSSYLGGPYYEYQVNGRGADIWGVYDEFHFRFIKLSGEGSIVARVMSVENTNTWAKAGVMIRDDLTPQSKHAMTVITPGQGVSFQRRRYAGGGSSHTTEPGVTAPRYVKLVRGSGGVFEGWHGTDEWNWTDVNDGSGGDSWDNITMEDPVYIGLCLTSHDGAELCTADFNNVHVYDWWGFEVTPGIEAGTGVNIGNNDPERLYVALKDGDGTVGVVHHNDVNAAAETSWQEWNIKLSDFGVNLGSIKKVYIGLGDRDNPQPGGGGILYVDDLRICPPRCVPAFGPTADLTGDCLVDYEDLDLLEDDWLMGDYTIYAQAVSGTDANLVGHWEFEGNLNDSGPYGYHATDPCFTFPGYAAGPSGFGQAIEFNGSTQYIVVGPVGISGAVPRTIAGWAKANTLTIPNWTPCFGFTSFTGTANQSFDIQRRNYNTYCLHVYGWERDMMDVDLEWHHLAGTYDGTTLRWYGDGWHYGTDSSRNLNTTDNVQMGKRAHDAGGYWPGRVDDVRIYSRELSHEEIMDLADVPSFYFPLVSPANLYDNEPNNFKKVNFRDYAILSNQWLEERLWP
jgi:hypothetical protein